MSQQSVSTPTPNTDEEFTVQALTIHGAFFECKCQDIIIQAKNWTLRGINYPVEYQGKESNLDIWAEKRKRQRDCSFLLNVRKITRSLLIGSFFLDPPIVAGFYVVGTTTRFLSNSTGSVQYVANSKGDICTSITTIRRVLYAAAV